jgi:glycosidase
MYFVGETFMDRQGIMSFVGPNMLDGQFDFPLYDTIMDVLAMRRAGFEALETSLHESETIYGKETLMSPLVGNHDKSRFMAFADGDMPDPVIPDEEELGWTKPPQVDNPESYEYLKLATSFILAIDGVPMIYYGDEVGLTGAGDPDNRRMMPLESELNDAQKSVREHFKKVAKLRQAHPALRYGNRRPLVAQGDRLAFVRRHLDDSVLCLWNRGKSEAAFELAVAPEMPDGSYQDALTGRTIEVQNGQATATLPALNSAFFIKQK